MANVLQNLLPDPDIVEFSPVMIISILWCCSLTNFSPPKVCSNVCLALQRRVCKIFQHKIFFGLNRWHMYPLSAMKGSEGTQKFSHYCYIEGYLTPCINQAIQRMVAGNVINTKTSLELYWKYIFSDNHIHLPCDYSNQGHQTKFSTNLTNKNHGG